MCNLHWCYTFCAGVILFALVLHLNCTALSQSESSNFFMYIMYTTRKMHKNYIRDPSGLFSIISHVSLSMISLTSSLSLKLYLNSLVFHRNIFGSSSKVFDNLRKSSDIFGNFWKFSENVRERSSGILFLPLEYKIHVFSPPCNILYIVMALVGMHLKRNEICDL